MLIRFCRTTFLKTAQKEVEFSPLKLFGAIYKTWFLRHNTVLSSCIVFRTYDESVSFHNKVVAESGVGSKRSFLEFPFRCSYKKLPSSEVVNYLQPLYKHGQGNGIFSLIKICGRSKQNWGRHPNKNSGLKKFRFQFPEFPVEFPFPFPPGIFPIFGWMESVLNPPRDILQKIEMHMYISESEGNPIVFHCKTFIYAVSFCSIFKRNYHIMVPERIDLLVTLSWGFLPQWWIPLTTITKNKQRQAGGWRRTSNSKQELGNERLVLEGLNGVNR